MNGGSALEMGVGEGLWPPGAEQIREQLIAKQMNDKYALLNLSVILLYSAQLDSRVCISLL